MSTNVDQKTIGLVQKSYPNVLKTATDVLDLSTEAFPDAQYTPAESRELESWIGTISSPKVTSEESLRKINSALSTRATLLGNKPSVADIALFTALGPLVSSWSDEQRSGESGYHHIVRHLDFVQTSPIFHLSIDDASRVKIDPTNVVSKIPAIDPKAEKERKKKEKEAAAAAGAATTTDAKPAAAAPATTTLPERIKENISAATEKVTEAVTGTSAAPAAASTNIPEGAPTKKKEKKEKAPKPAKAPAAPVKPLSPSLIDLRVGHILKAIHHPDADSLYVSTIACGDAPGTENTSEYEGQVVRTVCSGLNGLVPLADMQGRKIVAVCNLKPVTMRGIKSAAMVLAASPRDDDSHAGPVELVELPEGAVAGDRVYFEGWEEGEPDAVLNPKKKIWEAIQPGFTTTEDRQVAFDAKATEGLKDSGKALGKLRTKAGLCSVKTLVNATVR